MAGPIHADALNEGRAAARGWEEDWVTAFAQHAQKRFETRALVRAVVNGQDPVPLAYIFSNLGGGLVLVIAAQADLEPLAQGDHHHRAHHELWKHNRGAGQNEIWISRPEQAIFLVDRPKEQTLSTGFGYLGASRTPDVILPRTAMTPEQKTHHDHF